MVQVISLLYVPFVFYYCTDVRLGLCFGPPAFILESSSECPVGHVPLGKYLHLQQKGDLSG